VCLLRIISIKTVMFHSYSHAVLSDEQSPSLSSIVCVVCEGFESVAAKRGPGNWGNLMGSVL
jgi:hypothetical protein